MQKRVTTKFYQLLIKDSHRPQDQLRPVCIPPELPIMPHDHVVTYDSLIDRRGEKVNIGDYVESTTGTVRVTL